jgi:hypothetical protein
MAGAGRLVATPGCATVLPRRNCGRAAERKRVPLFTDGHVVVEDSRRLEEHSCLFLFTLGALDQSAFQGGGTLGLPVYCGVILNLGNVFTTLHIDTWLTSLVQSGMPAMVRNPYGFVLTISIIAFVLHFFVPWMTASTIIALVAMPIAEGLGFHPFIPVLVALIAGDHTILPYVNSGYAMVYFASEGELFTHAQARWPLVLEAILRPAALLLSVPVWQLMGLM